MSSCSDCVPEDQMIEINDASEIPESAWTDAGASFWCTHTFSDRFFAAQRQQTMQQSPPIGRLNDA